MSRLLRSPLLRRLVVIAALMFWLGGLTFYAAIVVPVGRSTLRPGSLQSFVTQRVSNYLNLACGLALAALAWDSSAAADGCLRRRRWRWLTWLGIALSLAALVWLHVRLDQYLDDSSQTIVDHDGMWPVHLLYLCVSTFQWLCAAFHTWLLLASWRAADAGEC